MTRILGLKNNEREIIMKDNIEHLKLVGIYQENFMGLQAGEVEFTGKENKLVVSGGNEAGKSRFISTVPFALGTQKIEEPVTKGMKTGKVILHYDGDCLLDIEKKISAKGAATLKVKIDGEEIKKPQEFLNRITSPVVINPVDFHLHFNDKQRIEFLYDVSGKGEDIARLDSLHNTTYTKRSDVNRQIKELQGKLKGVPTDDGTKVVSIKSLLDELQAEQKKNEDKKGILDKIEVIETRVPNIKTAVKENEEFIAQLQAEIEEYKERIAKLKAEKDELKPQYSDLKKQYAEMTDGAVEEVQKKINDLEETNEKGRKIETANEQRKELQAYEKSSDKLSDELTKIKTAKLDLLKDIPVKNLTIEGDSLMINGLPWSQQSTSEGIKNALRIAHMKDTVIKNCIIDFAPLDSNSRKEVIIFASEFGYFIICELVSDTPAGDIHMKDGKTQVLKQ